MSRAVDAEERIMMEKELSIAKRKVHQHEGDLQFRTRIFACYRFRQSVYEIKLTCQLNHEQPKQSNYGEWINVVKQHV